MFVDALQEAKRELELTAERVVPHQVLDGIAEPDQPRSSVFDYDWTFAHDPIRLSSVEDVCAGQRISVDAVGELEIVGVGGRGSRSIVFKATGSDGMPYAVKIAHRENDPYILDEPRRLAFLQKSGVCPSPVVAHGSDFVLKQWVEGVIGDDWIEAAVAMIDVQGLAGFLKRCAESCLEVKDLKPRNFVLTSDHEWHCIDPGVLVVGGRPLDVWRKLERYVLKHWCGTRTHNLRYLWARLRAS